MKENVENNDFNLMNENVDDWTATQFWEADPMQNGQSLCNIILYVNWEDKTANIETQMDTNSMAGEVWNGLASEYKIPEDTDFSRFAEFFKNEIQPILQKAGEGFESYWNGSNWKGRFSEEARDLLLDIGEKLQGAFTHDYMYSFDVLGAFGESKGELVDYLKNDKIDLMTVDLENEDELQEIIDSIDGGDVVILNMDSADYKRQLKDIQEELKDEEEE